MLMYEILLWLNIKTVQCYTIELQRELMFVRFVDQGVHVGEGTAGQLKS